MAKGIKLSKVVKIVELTQAGVSRPEIAEAVEASASTVFKYQKEFDLI